MPRPSLPLLPIMALLAALLAPPAFAQLSEAYTFIKAVRDRDGDTVTRLVQVPGTLVVKSRDERTGETALHIAAARADAQWLRFLLAAGADVDATDNQGRTPLFVAVGTRSAESIGALIASGADVDRGDRQGQTPLMRTVLARDIATARLLIAAGANPDRSDVVSGQSARSLARRDPRATMFVDLFATAKAKPAAKTYGPKL